MRVHNYHHNILSIAAVLYCGHLTEDVVAAALVKPPDLKVREVILTNVKQKT